MIVEVDLDLSQGRIRGAIPQWTILGNGRVEIVGMPAGIREIYPYQTSDLVVATSRAVELSDRLTELGRDRSLSPSGISRSNEALVECI
jgi:hypothetical protein